MKQNERILVYLVTGFLAVILLVAVFFGHDTKAAVTERTGEAQPRGLGELIDPKAPAENAADPNGSGEEPGAGEATTPPPLVASPPPSAAELVRQHLGESTRSKNVRIVRARPGDSLDSIVVRWCGSRTPYLEEANRLNETLVIPHPDQEITVPWVDDEDVLAAYEARQPKLEMPESGESAGEAAQPVATGPTFQVPGSGAGGDPATDASATPAAGTKVHVVKSGESYWGIAAALYGADKANRMVEVIRQLNPNVRKPLQPKTRLVVPASAQ